MLVSIMRYVLIILYARLFSPSRRRIQLLIESFRKKLIMFMFIYTHSRSQEKNNKKKEKVNKYGRVPIIYDGPSTKSVFYYLLVITISNRGENVHTHLFIL